MIHYSHSLLSTLVLDGAVVCSSRFCHLMLVVVRYLRHTLMLPYNLDV